MLLNLENQLSLLETLGKMGHAVSSRPVVPELSCIRVTAEKDALKLFTTTGHLSLSTTLSAKDIEVVRPGDVLVNYDLFYTSLSSIVGSIILESTAKSLTITSGDDARRKRKLQLGMLENLPLDVVVTGTPIVIPALELKNAISHVTFASIDEGSRPELRGMFLGSRAMCGDGVRLSTYSLGLDCNVTIPSHALAPLQSLLPDSGDVVLTIGKWISVEMPDMVLKFSSTDASFPDAASQLLDVYAQKVPIATVKIGTSVLQRVFTTASVYIEKAAQFGISYVTVHGTGSEVLVQLAVPTMGTFEDIIECEYEGGEFKFLLSPSHMLQLAPHGKSGTLEIRVFSELEPLLVKDADSDQWLTVQSVMATRDMVKEIEEDADDF